MQIDIMLPFYGDVDLMKRTVQSVILQSSNKWRLTVLDDGYPDASIPEWFAALNDSRVVYHRNESNIGANANYRLAVSMATNELCLILGADDLLHRNYIENILKLAHLNPNASIYHPGVEIIDEQGQVIETRTDDTKHKLGPWSEDVSLVSGEELAASLMHGNWMYFPAITWRTDDVKKVGFRSDLNVCQDLGLAVDLIKSGKFMVLSPEVTFQYRRHSASDSTIRAIRGDRFVEEKQFFKELSLEFKELGWEKASRSARLHLTSRLHAASLLPAAIKNHGAVLTLLRHIFS